MSLVTQLNTVLTRIATEFKSIRNVTGTLSNLTTADKTNLVAAINEVQSEVGSGGTIDADSITDATAVGKALIRASDAAAGRAAIGAGTSSLALGTTSSTAKAGDYAPAAADISDATTAGRTLLTAANAGAQRTALDVYTKAEADAAAAAAAAGVVNGAPGALDTLKELSDALGADPNFGATTATALGNRVRVDAAQSFTAPQKQQARDNIDVYSKTEVGDPTTDFVAAFEAALV